jgi:signal transduction histidine kinase
VSPLSRVNDPERLRTLVAALLGISSDLSLPHVLRNIVEAAVQVVDARYGALGVLAPNGHELSDFVNTGLPPEVVRTIGPLPQGRGILGQLIADPRPLRLSDLARHPNSFGFPPHHPPMHSFLGVPILLRDQVFGNLYLTEKRNAPEFTEEDEGLAVALAGAAAIAVENARLHARVRDLTLIEDRERIAADLHDTVIQRLFATGLTLEATLRAIADPDAAARIERAVEELDETIRQIRSTIFSLQTPRTAGRGVREQILALASEAGASLGFEPHLRLDGPIDHALDDDVAQHLLASLREALSNVVRHAKAQRVDITVRVGGGWLRAEVRDDGVGPGTGNRTGGRGVQNLTQRAVAYGGTATLSAAPEGGSVVVWEVPLPDWPGPSALKEA